MPKRKAKKKMAVVEVPIDADLKREVESILKAQGITVSRAIRLFYREVIRLKALPFDVGRCDGEVPSPGGRSKHEKPANPHRGSTFDEFLEEEGILDEVVANAKKRLP